MTDPIVTVPFEIKAPTVRDMLLGGGPRFARDAFGPPLAFYVGWRLSGLVLGIVLSTVVALAAHRHERRAGRPGAVAWLMCALVLVQALVGIVADSERVYLAQPVVVSLLFGLAFLVSIPLRRPLAGLFAGDLYPMPDFVRASETFRVVFGRISLAWGAYLVGRSALRLGVVASSSVEGFLVANLVTGVPLTALLMSWSVWYGVRSFRRSEEWGPAIRMLDELGVS